MTTIRMTQKRRSQAGFSLPELLISIGIFTVVSLLAFIVLQSSVEASRLTDTQGQMQAALRDVMQQISGELRSAYSERTIAPKNPDEKASTQIPAGTVAVTISNNGRTIQFQRPVASTTKPVPQPSTPITFSLQSEDTGFATGDAKLAPGEDANADGILNRRLVRTQSGTTTPVGGSNDVADVQFELLASPDSGDKNKTVLRIRLVSTKLIGAKNRLITADLESRINLVN